MGHEAAGTISEVGSAVDSQWNAGDRVTFDSTVYCGKCWYCGRGEVNLCDNRMVLGVSCDDYRRYGAFAEYVAVRAHILYRMPDAISFEDAAKGEAVSVAVHAGARTPMNLGDSAVVFGGGMIGLLCLQALKAAGCGFTAVVDLDVGKLETAKKLGADLGLDPSKVDVPNAIREATGGRGADLAFEAVGIAPTVQGAITSLRKGGSCTLVGNLAKTVDMPLQEIVTRQLMLIGTCASAGEYPACLDLIARGMIDVDCLISKVKPLKEGADWFARLHKGNEGLTKVILTP